MEQFSSPLKKAVGLKLEYGEPVEAGEYKGTFKAQK